MVINLISMVVRLCLAILEKWNNVSASLFQGRLKSFLRSLFSLLRIFQHDYVYLITSDVQKFLFHFYFLTVSNNIRVSFLNQL